MTLAARIEGQDVIVWDKDTGTTQRTFNFEEYEGVKNASLTRNLLFVICGDGKERFYRLSTGEPITLAGYFTTVLQDSSKTAENPYLRPFSQIITEIEFLSQTQPTLGSYVRKLLKLADSPGFAHDGNLTNEFAEISGEAYFFVLCANKGIVLERVQEGAEPSPDFHYKADSIDIYFEVKTPSVVGGKRGVHEALKSALAAQLSLEAQGRAQKRIRSAVWEVSPYGDASYRRGMLTAVINVLIEKTRGSIKSGQFSKPNTFLVVNLSMIPPYCTDNRALRAAYSDGYLYPKPLTGELWMLAFARPGMLVHGIPNTEGWPAIEGIVDKCGILSDPEYNQVSGLLIMLQSWQRAPEIYGLFRHEDYWRWVDDSPQVSLALSALTGDAWNDDGDTNAWQLPW